MAKPNDAALAALGVTREAIARQPVITPQLTKLAKELREMAQTVPSTDARPESAMLVGSPIYYLQAADDTLFPDARRILDAYYSVSRGHRKLLPIEAFCVAAGVPTLRALEIIVATAVRLGAQASTMLVAVTQPAVVRKTVEMALTDDGVADRAMLHRATGLTPLPKGSQTTVNVSAQAGAVAAPTVAAIAAAPPPERTIQRLVDRFNVARGLPAGGTTPTAAPALPAAPERLPDYVELTDGLGDGVEVGADDGGDEDDV